MCQTDNCQSGDPDSELRAAAFGDELYTDGMFPIDLLLRGMPQTEERADAATNIGTAIQDNQMPIAGRIFARNSATTVVSLRFTNVALPEVQAEFPWPAPTPENPLTLVMWAYADGRDVVEAQVLALDAEVDEYEAFMIAQPSSRLAEPTIDIIQNNFGDRVEIREGLGGTDSVISTDKAQRLLGWTPRHDWR